MSESKTEGWGVIRPGDRKAHYYRETMSLCRRVGFYGGPLDADSYPSADDCAACRKELAREAAKKPASPTSAPGCDKALDSAGEVCPSCGHQHLPEPAPKEG